MKVAGPECEKADEQEPCRGHTRMQPPSMDPPESMRTKPTGDLEESGPKFMGVVPDGDAAAPRPLPIYPSCKRVVDSALFRGCGEVLCFRDAFYNLNDTTYTQLCKRPGRVGYPVGWPGRGWGLVRARG
jgi:hypothetical protein